MVLVTGAQGQLGHDVVNELKRREMEHTAIDIADLDITDGEAAGELIGRVKPSCVVHCAAYTAVDKAEEEPVLCMRVNSEGTDHIARACGDIGAELVYISTDYVFSGEGDAPYETGAHTAPLSVYGKSKLAGEEAVRRHLDRFYIVRISWAFGINGGNFAKTMLRLARDRSEINVVDDQVGSPTYTADLAALLCDMALSGKYGVYHASNEGYCSWADFAAEIVRLGASGCRINPIPSSQYPTKAIRPMNSRLSKESLDIAGFARLPHWKDALVRFMSQGGFV